MKSFPTEELKALLSDDRNFISLCRVQDVIFNEDRTAASVLCDTFGERDTNVIEADLTWSACSLGGGIFQLPALGSMVLVAYPQGNNADAVVVARLSAVDDEIPEECLGGDLVVKSLPDNNLHLQGQSEIRLFKNDAPEKTQSAVQGEKLVAWLKALTKILEDFMADLGNKSTPQAGQPFQLGTEFSDIATELQELSAGNEENGIDSIDTVLSEFLKMEES